MAGLADVRPYHASPYPLYPDLGLGSRLPTFHRRAEAARRAIPQAQRTGISMKAAFEARRRRGLLRGPQDCLFLAISHRHLFWGGRESEVRAHFPRHKR